MKNSSKNIFDIKKKVVIISGGAGFLGSEFSLSLSTLGAIPIILQFGFSCFISEPIPEINPPPPTDIRI